MATAGNPLKACIVLPTKNEEKSVGPMIKKALKLKMPVFIIDEQSTDKTAEIAKSLNVPIYQRKRKGKGSGVIEALQIAERQGFDLMVLIDCDMTYPVELTPKLLSHISDYDMVVGARSMEAINFFHRLGNRIHTSLVNLLFLTRLTDINSGFRVMKVKQFVNTLDAEGFDIEAQITAKALKKKLSIKEIPIEYRQRMGASKIFWRDGLLIFWKILKEKFL